MKLRGRFVFAFGFFCLFLAIVLCVFYFPFLSGAHSFYQSDLTYYFEPFVRYICNEYRHGRSPLWNPYLYCGMSQVAVPSPGMFYPPILFFLLPFSRGMAAFLAFHQFVAGVGAFLLVASLGWGLLAAAIAGVGAAMCGYMFSVQSNFTLVATVAWLPILIFGLRKIDETRSRRNVGFMFLSAVSMGLLAGAGRPELSVPAGLIAVICIGGIAIDRLKSYGRGGRSNGSGGREPALNGDRSDENTRRIVATTLLLQLASLIAGGLLATPVILPALEWAQVSPRAHGLDLNWVLLWSSNWYDCICMLFAQPLGDLTYLGSPYLDMVASRQYWVPYITSSYVGPVLFCLAIWGLFGMRGKLRWGIAAVGFGLLLMSLGKYTPVAPALSGLSPVFAAFRYPVKLLIFPSLALVMLAAGGTWCAVERRVPLSAQITTFVLWGLLVAAGFAFLNVSSLSSLAAHFPWNAGKHVDFSHMHQAQLLFGNSFIIAGGIGLVVNALYFAFSKENISRDMFGVAVIFALVATLLWPAYIYDRHGTMPGFYDRTPGLAAPVLRELGGDSQNGAAIAQRALTLYFDPLTVSNFFLANYRLGYQDGFFLYARHLLLPNNNVDFRVPFAFGYEAAEVGRYKHWFDDALARSTQRFPAYKNRPPSDVPLARFCKATAVSLVLTQQHKDSMKNLVPKLDSKFFTLESDDRILNLRKYSVIDRLPRAYFAGATKLVDWDQFHLLMLDASVPALPTDTIIADKSSVLLTDTYIDEAIPTCDSSPGGTISFSADEPNNIILNTDRATSGLLVLTDQFYPGWHCTIDGAITKIFRVNGFARGIVLSPGHHRIEFRYLPASVALGFDLFFLVLSAFALAFLACFYRRS